MTKIAASRFLINEDDGPKLVDFEAFLQWARKQIAQGKGTTKAIEHMANWIGDDLHVRRLRRLWIEISDSLGKLGRMLPDDKDLNPEAPATPQTE